MVTATISASGLVHMVTSPQGWWFGSQTRFGILWAFSPSRIGQRPDDTLSFADHVPIAALLGAGFQPIDSMVLEPISDPSRGRRSVGAGGPTG